MKKEEYIAEVISLVKNKTTKREIQKELEAHIEDRISYYTDAGYDEEYATCKAVEKMGEPKAVAKSMEKLHNNSIYIILTVVFLLLYIGGMVVADIKSYEYAIINMVDFVEKSSWYPSVISSLMFLCGAFAFFNARKSKSSGLLSIVGIVSIATPFVSLYSLIPFGYTVVSLFTDFPAAIIQGEVFFSSDEIFWQFEKLTFDFLGYPLIILSILFSLLFVVIAIASFVSANEFQSDRQSKALDKKINRFAIFILLLGILATVTATAESLYDYVYVSNLNNYYEQRQGVDYFEAKGKFDEIELPISNDEAIKYAKENEIDDYFINDFKEFGTLELFNNDQYWVLIADYDDDGIIESKRLMGRHIDKFTSQEKKMLNSLEEGSSFEMLTNIISPMEFVEYDETFDDGKIDVYVSISSYDNEYFEFEYENGKLVESSYDDLGEDMEWLFFAILFLRLF